MPADPAKETAMRKLCEADAQSSALLTDLYDLKNEVALNEVSHAI